MDPRLSRAQRAWQRGDSAGALSDVRELARLPDASFDILEVLAQLCENEGLLDEARSATEKALALNPSSPDAWQRLGVIHLQRGDFAGARNAFERVVELDPGSASARTNLGSALLQSGLPALAIDRHREALARDPAYAVAHSNLAAALAMCGEYDEALHHARRAIALNPSFLSPYMHAAFLEADRERFDEAVAWLDNIPGSMLHNAPALTSKAEILNKADRRIEAVAICDEAIRLQPGYGDAHLCRGDALAVLGRFDEASAAFGEAGKLMPRSSKPLARKAAMLLELAKPAEALALFDEARAVEPHSPSVLHGQAAAKEFRLDGAEIAELENLVSESSALSATDRVNLHFTLASAYLQTKEYPKVFPHLESGSRLKRRMVDYDPDGADRFFADVAAAFPAGPIEDASGNPSDLPIFVVGVPRSGTTLVEQILASHPEVEGRGELRDFPAAARVIADKYRALFPAWVAKSKPEDFTAIGSDYLTRVGAPAAGKRRVVDKMPGNAILAGLIASALPNARILLCRRDPLDTCFSCYSRLFTARQGFTYDLTELGRYYRSHEALMAHWRRVLPPARFLEVSYEDVVADIEGMSRKIVAFCGLDWSDECLRFHESKRPVRTASMLQVRKPLYTSSIGRWRPFRNELAPLFAALGMSPPQDAEESR